ncbi:Shedu immune nuclease family protein [Paenalcaligenes faecalis]|uniref:Shedu immune nuclease family protein n=1 Tax=Paenalcaligenes faecalis TaxID=2980099 RepID=UPI0022B94BE1|nr:Shedu immune nuclease family protein [Paenalcaligenes faecalis]
MSRLLPKDFRPEDLKIVIEEMAPNCVEVFYLPGPDELKEAGLEATKPNQYKVRVALFNQESGFITVFPIFTLPTNPNYLKQKYKHIKAISVAVAFDSMPNTQDDVVELLQMLPLGFIKDIRYGLGLLKEYYPIISALEEHMEYDCLAIDNKKTGSHDSECFYLNFNDYDEMRRSCNRITERARKAARITKAAATYNHIAYRLGVEQKPLPTTNDAISKMLRIKITDTDKQVAMDMITEDKRAIKQTDSVTLAKLRSDIELVSLERLITSYEDLFSKNTKEDTWQTLFNQNPFILSLAFGYPAIKISDQASVGGKRLRGDGEKIADYLIKNGITNNLALIEIKKPSSVLLKKTAYRGSVYCGSTELTGSVTQVLDQCYQLQQNIATIKNNNRLYDIESYAIHCILIIGTMPDDEDERKSFELYRRNSRNVQITTFDELLLKIKQLHEFLSNNDEKGEAAP